jgi:hypothetical protein
MKTGIQPTALSLNDAFDLFVGVDQTGAARDGGRAAKPLPLAILTMDKRPRLMLHDQSGRPLNLASFTRSSLESSLASAGVSQASRRVRSFATALLVDCVLGLPQDVWPVGYEPGAGTLWELFAAAARDTAERKGYGLKPAASFFASLLAESRGGDGQAPTVGTRVYPARKCEIRANANSVFRTHPFQKNIQCGTYRIWRDLGASVAMDGRWLNIRHFTPERSIRHDSPWLFEAYPSLLWREALGLKSRNLALLLAALESKLPELEIAKSCRDRIREDADAADAAVLAAGGLILQRQKRLFESAPSRSGRLAIEGWIIGLENKPMSGIS